MTNQEDIAQMASLMLALTQPDTETIRQAEHALKPILKDARSVPALLEVIKARGIHVSAIRVKRHLPNGNCKVHVTCNLHPNQF